MLALGRQHHANHHHRLCLTENVLVAPAYQLDCSAMHYNAQARSNSILTTLGQSDVHIHAYHIGLINTLIWSQVPTHWNA